MIKISGSTIQMTRGDTLSIKVDIFNSDGTTYEVQEDDIIRFAMKKKYKDPQPLIIKVLDHETLRLQLNPEDTEALEYGDYVYDVEITMGDGTVDTFIAEATLTLTKEVYQWTD